MLCLLLVPNPSLALASTRLFCLEGPRLGFVSWATGLVPCCSHQLEACTYKGPEFGLRISQLVVEQSKFNDGRVAKEGRARYLAGSFGYGESLARSRI